MGLASSLGIDIGNSGGGIFSGTNLPEFMKSRFIIEKTLIMILINRVQKSFYLIRIFFDKLLILKYNLGT